MTSKKKLIEVALPLEAINVASAREMARIEPPQPEPRCYIKWSQLRTNQMFNQEIPDH